MWVRPERQADGEPIVLDGSQGEGGGQILRTALSLSILTGRAFRLVKVRAKREKPGLRPQHLKAVEAAAELSNADVRGGSLGSREVWFRPGDGKTRDLNIDIGTAGATSLVLQTLYLPIALRAEESTGVVLTGGTFNPMAPPYPFLNETWRAYLALFGLQVGLEMPLAGFYPRGGGRVEARIEPGHPVSWGSQKRGRLRSFRGIVGVCRLRDEIAERMRARATARLASFGADVDIELERWAGPGQGTAISITADYDGIVPATFVGLGERGKTAEAVADEAVNSWQAFHDANGSAVDPHSADQILLPLALADGPSAFSVSEITEHLRTNARTIHAFLGRSITIEEAKADGGAGQVLIEA